MTVPYSLYDQNLAIAVPGDGLAPNDAGLSADTVLTTELYIDGLVQEIRNSSALAMELCLSCTNPLICFPASFFHFQ